MSDIINIVVHPGYCIGCDGYDQEVYYNQLDKGDFNLFLHPTVDEVGRAVVIKQNIKQVLKEACKNRSIPEVEDLIKLEDCDSINFPYAGYVFRQFMFYKFKSIKKKHKRTKKSYSKILKSLILNNEKFAKQYLFMVSNTRPIITGNKITTMYKEFRTTLEDKYPSENKETNQKNVHLDATYFNQFSNSFPKFYSECVEASDKIYVF